MPGPTSRVTIAKAAASVTGEQTNTDLATTIFAFLSDWRDHAKYADAFERLSSKAAEAMDVRTLFASVKWNEFGAADWFAAIDRRIVDEMAEGVRARTIRHEDVVRVVAERRNTHWFGRYSGLYLGLEAASAFLGELAQTEFQPATADEAVRSYAESWSRLDGYYRTFTAFAHETRKSDETLAALAEGAALPAGFVSQELSKASVAGALHPSDLTKKGQDGTKVYVASMSNKAQLFVVGDPLNAISEGVSYG